jgi:hypothetical protein
LKGAQATETLERLAFQTDATNSLDGMNCLSIVVELDVATVLGPDAGPLLAVVGETSGPRRRRPVRLERMGRPEIKNVIMSPRKFDTVNRDLEIRDLYNAEDTFSLSRDYLGRLPLPVERQPGLLRPPGRQDRLAARRQGGHPLTELLFADFLVVDSSKPFRRGQLPRDRAGRARRPPAHHLRRPPAERRHRRRPLHPARTRDRRRRVSDGVDEGTRPATRTFPYLLGPNPEPPGLEDRARRADGRARGAVINVALSRTTTG